MARILSRRFHHHADLPDFRLPGQYLFEPRRKIFRAGAGSWKALHRQLADRHARLPVRNGQYGRIKKRFGHIDAHPVKWLGLLPRLRAPLIISWYTKRHRQYGFLDHPRLCGLRAQDSVRLPERAAGKTSQSGFRGPARNSPPLPFHYLTPPREKARKDSKPSGVIHMPTPIHKRKRSKKKTLRRLRDCSAFPPKTIIQGGTTKQSAANNSLRLTDGEWLWRPEKIAAVAPSQRRLKVLFKTAVLTAIPFAPFRKIVEERFVIFLRRLSGKGNCIRR